MNILCIDTSTELLSVVASSGRDHISLHVDRGLVHAEQLLLTIHRVCTLLHTSLSRMDLLACCAGPGSFTGLRIGLATIKGLSVSLGIPFVLVPTLDAYALSYRGEEYPVLPVIDGRKQRYYTALYLKGERRTEYLDLTLGELSELTAPYKRVSFVGPHAERCKDTWFPDDQKVQVVPRFREALGREVLALARSIYEQQGAAPTSAQPLYLRLSEAEIGITRRAD
ncbi:universal protein YeaZ [Spirochaeta thermophila DSM 6578]|uniref:Universal protein YeaZ n=1 Tax=Winmispira thermophila (strain ATCC 700085 / DSM 6578 / Z-1203) TaxID=869211 RepID=G0GFX1_WINT7|nr:tRNA (adenosine(37)-N6)-threonylcarbamoyltransferase complex dimerization subunit type 1 TsaB [Spirochaeta thermophila]AEJ61664.1 universal protein YeaZ [Spirochaeta thermophila DSM 6578]